MYTLSEEQLKLLKSGEWVNDTEFKEIMRVERLDLRGADLYRAYLEEANLYRAILRCSDLSRADLYMANLSRADLYKAYLRCSNLSRANLYMAYLSRADLYMADLRCSDLRGANLYMAYLYMAELTGAIINKYNFDTYIDQNIWMCEIVKDDIVRIKRKDNRMYKPNTEEFELLNKGE